MKTQKTNAMRLLDAAKIPTDEGSAAGDRIYPGRLLSHRNEKEISYLYRRNGGIV